LPSLERTFKSASLKHVALRSGIQARLNPVGIAARLARAPVDADTDAMAEIALETLSFLDAECQEGGVDPGPTAHFAVLDLAAALVAFGSVRGIDELVSWLRQEVPARAGELAKTVSDARLSLADAPTCACLATPAPASWH
jgi:hypothetical protein